jgi:hypothetical protein
MGMFSRRATNSSAVPFELPSGRISRNVSSENTQLIGSGRARIRPTTRSRSDRAPMIRIFIGSP